MVDEFVDFSILPMLDFKLEDLEGKIGVIISGAPLLITEQNIDPYLSKIAWIKESNIPVLGICFGHQLIGLLYGAIGSKMREDRSWQEIEIIEESPLFNRLPDCFEMMEDHCEHISIPPEFKLMAASDACINECMQHEKKSIYGVQFHPEVSGNFGNILLENFFYICEKE
jgi:GMP synthase (glutamine-hydrolysing)